MADIAQLQSAFLKAHDAGDKEGAAFLAKQIRAAQTQPDVFQRLAGENDEGRQSREDFMRAAWHHASGLPLGAAQLGMNLIGQGDGINNYMNQREAEYRSKIGDTAAGDLGAVIGELAPSAGAIGYVGKGVKAISGAAGRLPMLQKALGYTGEGAALGGLMPVAGDDYWGGKGAQVATGAALQPVAMGAGKAIGAAVNGVARSVKPTPEAVEFAGRFPGVSLPWWKSTGGGLRNAAESMKSMPLTRDTMVNRERDMFTGYNQQMAGRATPPRLPVTDEAGNILRWEENKPTGAIGSKFVEEAGDQFNKAYGALYANRTIPVDEQYLGGVRGMLDEVRNYKPDLLPQVEGRINQIHSPLAGVKDFSQQNIPRTTYDTIFNRQVGGGTVESGGHVGVGADRVKEAIAAAHAEASALANEGKHGAAQYLRDYAGQLEGMRMRGLPPEVASEMQPLNEAFRNFAQYRHGMMNPAAQANEMLTPNQHLRAIMQNGRKFGGANTGAAGQLPNQQDAVLANKVMGQTIPDSGTGSRVFGMLGMLNPKMFAADWAASKAMHGGLPHVLTGDTSAQRWLQGQQKLKSGLSNALRAAPGVIGGQQGVE